MTTVCKYSLTDVYEIEDLTLVVISYEMTTSVRFFYHMTLEKGLYRLQMTLNKKKTTCCQGRCA